MGKVMDAINDFLFPVAADDHSVVDESVKTDDLPLERDGLPFEVNERAYYVNRVDSRLQSAHRAKRSRKSRTPDPSGGYYPEPFFRDDVESFRDNLEELSLSTLVMIDEHRDLSDIDNFYLEGIKENMLRSALYMSALSGVEYSLTAFKKAVKVMRDYHSVPEDLTDLPLHQARAVSAASRFIIGTGLFEACPPRVTAFIMERPDRVEDIQTYAKTYGVDKNSIHSINLGSVQEFLENPSQSLREGAL